MLSPEACGWLEGRPIGDIAGKGKEKASSAESRPIGHAPRQSLEKAAFDSSTPPEGSTSLFSEDVQDSPGEGYGARIASGTLVELRR